VRKLWANGFNIAGVNHPVQILIRDSRSDPNRASEVTSELIKRDHVDLITTAHSPDVVPPVADQAEINGVPCVTNDCPWQPYFFSRGGKPDKGFDWTYHFFWGLEDIIAVYTGMWDRLPTNKVVGALWGNDADGNAYADANTGFPPALRAKGFKLIDPGRFNQMTNDFSAQISRFKAEKVEILTGVLPPPAFSTFWSQAAQQAFRPKVANIAKALLFPAAVNALGDRATGLTTEVWWSPYHPFKSSLTGLTSAQWSAQYEKDTGRQWTQPIGFTHALFEVIGDVFKRVNELKPAVIRDAIVSTNMDTIVGHVQWTPRGPLNPVKNVCRTPLVGGQWEHGTKYKYNLLIVDNSHAPNIPTTGTLKQMVYT
jgi:branched-chain amino acid transport system substrate-binding protein